MFSCSFFFLLLLFNFYSCICAHTLHTKVQQLQSGKLRAVLFLFLRQQQKKPPVRCYSHVNVHECLLAFFFFFVKNNKNTLEILFRSGECLCLLLLLLSFNDNTLIESLGSLNRIRFHTSFLSFEPKSQHFCVSIQLYSQRSGSKDLTKTCASVLMDILIQQNLTTQKQSQQLANVFNFFPLYIACDWNQFFCSFHRQLIQNCNATFFLCVNVPKFHKMNRSVI